MKKIAAIMSVLAMLSGTIVNADTEHMISEDGFNVDAAEYGNSIFETEYGWTTTADVSKAAAEGTTATYEQDPLSEDNGVVMLKRDVVGTATAKMLILI